MNCRRVESLLGEYMDGALPVDERRAVEDHFADCAPCVAAKEEMDLALEFLGGAPNVDVPEGLVANILDVTVHAGPPAGGMAVAGGGVMGWVRPLLQPLFEPRFAMSVALAIVSFSILTWSGEKTLDRWQNADPIAQVRTATTGLDRAWERGVAVYHQAFSTPDQETQAPDKGESPSLGPGTLTTP